MEKDTKEESVEKVSDTQTDVPSSETDTSSSKADTSVQKQSTIDPEIISQLKASQNLPGAFIGGLLGAIIGAFAWAVITDITQYQIGYMAIGVGFLTGFLIRKLGHGFEKHYGYIGAAFSLIGCFAGNILAALIIAANQNNISYILLIKLLNFKILSQVASETFDIMDLLFYGIAIYEGYRFSFITREEVISRINKIKNSKAA